MLASFNKIYSNPILPPQYCLLRPLCLYLSFPSRLRRPSRDALYARNEKKIIYIYIYIKERERDRNHRGAQNLDLGSEPRKFSIHFLHMSKKQRFCLHYCYKTEVYTSEVDTEVLFLQ